MCGPQMRLCLFTFRPIASKLLNSLKTDADRTQLQLYVYARALQKVFKYRRNKIYLSNWLVNLSMQIIDMFKYV